MDIKTYDQREKQLELREKLIKIEERRQAGVAELLDSFDRCIEALEEMPNAGFEKAVKIEYIIDDRQNYGMFVY